MANRSYISLDLGTANTLVYVSGQGVVFNEPSFVAYDLKSGKMIGFGEKAYKMVGKTHKNIRIVRPLLDGVIADMSAAKDFLHAIFNRMRLSNTWKGAIVCLACPSGVTELERVALKKIPTEMGAKYVHIEEEVKMSAVGSGVNIFSPEGNLIVDIGGGTTDIAVISAGDIVVSRSAKIAGNYFSDEIRKYVRSEHNLVIGETTSESIKKEIGSLIKVANEKRIKTFGRDVITGLPKECEIHPDEIRNLLFPPFSRITDMIVEVLESTPAELSGDVLKNGIIICGGGALIKGVDKYFSEVFGIPVVLATNPLLSVINGTKAFEKHVYELLDHGYIDYD